VVRRGGRIVLLEAARPDAPLLRAGHSFYFDRIVPLIGGALSSTEAYRYLPASMEYLPPPEGIVRMLRAAGFPDAYRRRLSGGVVQLLAGTRA
jgi:demethylmenaquinone methyltransferase / 2-methoxy-6-polyprenyl-1,4-benzoquinol methylase